MIKDIERLEVDLSAKEAKHKKDLETAKRDFQKDFDSVSSKHR